MPIYEYQCSVCGHQLEAIQKMSEEALTECPVCHKATLTKLVSAAGFQLKGTGWYVTDFRDKGKQLPPTTKSEGTADSGSTAESSSTNTSTSKDDKNSSSSSTTGGTT